MPTYEIDSIKKDLHKLSIQPKPTKTTVSNDKISIPRADFNAILEAMEVLSAKMNESSPEIASVPTLSSHKYSEHKLPYWCDMCPTDHGILGVRYHCLECENFDMCESCFMETCKNSNMDIPGTHQEYHDIQRVVPPTARPEYSSNTKYTEIGRKYAQSAEHNVLEFNVDELDQDLFNFYENLGTSTSVLRELKSRYEKHEDLERRYKDLLAEQRDLSQVDTVTDFAIQKKNSNASSDGIAVSFDLKDKNCIVFTILNDTKDYIIPKNSSLHFRFGKNKDDLTKCYLKLSDKEAIQPGSLQILRFNHMFDDYNILQQATYYEIKIMNVDKVLFERTIENPGAAQSKFEDLTSEVKQEATPVLKELSIDEDYDILSDFDEN